MLCFGLARASEDAARRAPELVSGLTGGRGQTLWHCNMLLLADVYLSAAYADPTVSAS